jgi:hypothetical protein
MVCMLWAVLGKVARLSTNETIHITPIILLLEGCSLYRLVEGRLEVSSVLALGLAFIQIVGASLTLSFLSSVLCPSLLLNIKGCY